MKHLTNPNQGAILIRRWQNPVTSLIPRTKGRISVHLKRFFCAYRFLVGCVEALRCAVSFDGRINFAQPATLLVDPLGGSFLIQRRLHHV
jgi:hypothetical protein